MLSLAGIILQAIELETRWVSEWSRHYDSARQFDQQEDVSSFKTDIDEIVARLRSLNSTVEGTDMEHLVIQCVEHCEDISQMAMTLEMANYSKRGALAPYIYHKSPSLRQRLITLVLRSIRYVHSICMGKCHYWINKILTLTGNGTTWRLETGYGLL